MIMDVRLAVVLLFLVFDRIVVAVDKGAVVVLVRVPERIVRPFAHHAPMAVGDMVMVVRVDDGGMGVFGLVPVTFGVLRLRHGGLLVAK
jgi:hypothetical protein